MADPVQPSYATLALASGGRYDPLAPGGDQKMRDDFLAAVRRAEAQRAAKSAMEERKALQYIQQEAARPSRQEAPGVRSIFKDGRLVGYSTMPEAREAAEPAPQRKPMGTALEQGFISALKRADASKAARDAAEKAKASGKPVPQEVEETVTEKVVEKPAPVFNLGAFGAGLLPPTSQAPNASQSLMTEMQRILASAKEAPARAVMEQKKAKIAELTAQRDEVLKNLQNRVVPGFASPMMASGGMGLFGQPQLQPLAPQGEAQLAAAIERINAQIAALEAETK